MPCPLCHEAIPDLCGNVCPFCCEKFVAERAAAERHPGILPKVITDASVIGSYHAWLAGKCAHREALWQDRSDDEAEQIGFAKMEEKMEEVRNARARQQARIAQERAMQSRLFRHI